MIFAQDFKEQTLSEKGVYDFNGDLKKETDYCYLHEDVKDFIKKLKESLPTSEKAVVIDFAKVIDKLAGDKLI